MFICFCDVYRFFEKRAEIGLEGSETGCRPTESLEDTGSKVLTLTLSDSKRNILDK